MQDYSLCLWWIYYIFLFAGIQFFACAGLTAVFPFAGLQLLNIFPVGKRKHRNRRPDCFHYCDGVRIYLIVSHIVIKLPDKVTAIQGKTKENSQIFPSDFITIKSDGFSMNEHVQVCVDKKSYK